MLWFSCGLLSALAAPPSESIRVIDPYVRRSVTRTSAAYLTLESADTVEHTLVGISSDAAGVVEIHTMVQGPRGVMQMRPLPQLVIAPGAKVTLAPGGDHIMLIDLKGPLKEGSVTLVLRFEDGATMSVVAPIR